MKFNAKVKKRIADTLDGNDAETRDKAIQKASEQSLRDWMGYCGVTDPADIDYSHPAVSLEYLLCDPVTLKGLQDPEKRKAFLDSLTEEERYVYYHGFWAPSYPGEVMTEPPTPYTVLETPPSSKKLLRDATKIIVKMPFRR